MSRHGPYEERHNMNPPDEQIEAAILGLRNGMGLPTKFIKQPVEVEAIRWGGDNIEAIQRFCSDAKQHGTTNILIIQTLEGPIYAIEGDWIIKGVKGEFYPCKPDIFAVTYKLA